MATLLYTPLNYFFKGNLVIFKNYPKMLLSGAFLPDPKEVGVSCPEDNYEENKNLIIC
jgi:hypothetical protein